ncbi:PAS domain-containing protein [Methylobacter sp. Wu8]|uniref:PAS domain-containing sensor histidine kinase n=1 Tax=Methylobacter sp. Wu8 TaxID=3118457 RepID=UPI002F325BD5
MQLRKSLKALEKFAAKFSRRSQSCQLCQQVDDERSAQQALVSSEQKFRALAEHSPDIIARYDLQCRVLYINPQFEKVLDTSGEVLGKTPMELNLGGYYDEYQAKAEAVIRTGQSDEMELSVLDDGENFSYYHVRFVSEFGPDGEIVGALAIGRNITKQHRVERLLLNLSNSIPGVLTAVRHRPGGGVNVVYASLGLRDLFGLDFEEVKDGASDLLARIHPEDLPSLIQVIDVAARTMTIFCHEYRVNHPTRGEVWVESRTTPVREADGRIIWYSCSSDITERRRLQNALAERERQFRTLAENAPDKIIRHDSETRLLYINPVLERTLKLTTEQVEGKRTDELFPQSRIMRDYQDVLAQVIATGKPANFEMIGKLPGSSRASYDLIRLVPELDQYGQVTGAIAIGRDYTEQKRLEQELRRREREFRTLAENLPDIIVRYDRDYRRIYLNPAYAREVGIPLARIWNKTPAEIWKPLIPCEEYMDWLKRVMVTGEPGHILLEWNAPDGGRVSYDTRAVAEYDGEGQVIGALAIGHNITEIKATERHLEESRAQLRALTAKREKDREEERKRIGREIHDELGQLLSVLRLNVTTLDFRFGDANPDLRDKAQKMVSVMDRAILMVRDLATRLRPVMLSSGIVSALEWMVKEYTESTGIVCELHVSNDDFPLDESRAIEVFRIIQESLTNVLRHSGADRVDITLRNEAGVCKVDVQDNGKGFDPARVGRRGSLGIIGMQERTLGLNGTLDIIQAESGGMVLKLRIPIEEQDETCLELGRRCQQRRSTDILIKE